ncbi:MAG: family 16 glycosylhydrolase [Acidobacteria bacterium]|nr:family 16 glycosylhydrolase [Acidobacteriota bacterium]
MARCAKAYNHMIGAQKGKKITVNDVYGKYHIYSIEWTSEKVDFMVDGVIYNTVVNDNKTTAEWPFDQNFHLKINNAQGLSGEIRRSISAQRVGTSLRSLTSSSHPFETERQEILPY